MHKENWKNQNYAASCSVSDRVLFQCLKDYPYIENVYICFDNDEPGQAAADRISTKLFALGLESKILIPTHKDWNRSLTVFVRLFFLPGEKERAVNDKRMARIHCKQ